MSATPGKLGVELNAPMVRLRHQLDHWCQALEWYHDGAGKNIAAILDDDSRFHIASEHLADCWKEVRDQLPSG